MGRDPNKTCLSLIRPNLNFANAEEWKKSPNVADGGVDPFKMHEGPGRVSPPTAQKRIKNCPTLAGCVVVLFGVQHAMNSFDNRQRTLFEVREGLAKATLHGQFSSHGSNPKVLGMAASRRVKQSHNSTQA